VKHLGASLHLLLVFSFALLAFFFLTPQTYAVQPATGSWTFAGLSSYQIGGFAVNPNNKNILYAGTAGGGIFKSIDRGNSWNAVNNGMPDVSVMYITEIVIDPVDSNIVYAGASGADNSGGAYIFKSTDGGATWSFSNSGITDVGFGAPPRDVQSMIIDPNSSSTLYVALGTHCGSVYKTTNGAGTWSRSSGLPCDPALVRLNPLNASLLYARSVQGINNSVDAGMNWNNISSFGANQVFYALDIDYFNSSILYANSDTGVYTSIDSGANWTLSNSTLSSVYKALIADPARPNTVYAGQNFSGGGVYMSTDAGQNWSAINNNLPSLSVINLFLKQNDPVALYAGTNKGVYVYGLQPVSTPTPTPTSIPSVSLNVPVLKQTSNPWQGNIYDSANIWSPSNPTINSWGCAVTSAAMVFKYHGISKLPNGTLLDPGTLNTWLKSQPDGYIREGWVNWLALTRLSKLAKNINGVSFDALEYKRTSGSNTIQLTNDINNSLPDILEEPGHFIVGKGINGTTFSINDPYYNRQTLNDGYSNTFLSLGRYVPSHTDLSYIMVVVNADVNLSLLNNVGNEVGESFVQQPITDPVNSQKHNAAIRILYAPQLTDGDYKIIVSGNKNKTAEISTYLYDTQGNVNLADIQIADNASLTVSFNKNNSNNSKVTKIVSFQTTIEDIKELRQLNLLHFSIAISTTALLDNAERLHNSGKDNQAKQLLDVARKLINESPKRFVEPVAKDILIYDFDQLTTP